MFFDHISAFNRVHILFILCLFLLSCSASVTPGYIDKDKETTVKAIELFHSQLSRGEFESIYNNLHPSFQSSMPKDAIINKMRETSASFGQFQSITDSRVELIMGAPVQVRAVYNTKFVKQDATEMFTYVKEGSSIRLAQYGIWPGTVAIPKEGK